MNLFYRAGWRGQVSAGPILLLETNTNEMTVTGTFVGSLQKKTSERLSFGPRVMIGGYNEVSMSMVIGL